MHACGQARHHAWQAVFHHGTLVGRDAQLFGRMPEQIRVWLEGADDLTPEAQAFLRRILETHSADVLFVLECRDASRLQEPIRSRCKMKRLFSPTWDDIQSYLRTAFQGVRTDEIEAYLLPQEYSYRRAKQCAMLQLHHPDQWTALCTHRMRESELVQQFTVDNTVASSSHLIMQYYRNAFHPERLLQPFLTNPAVRCAYSECMDVAGSSWALLGSAFDMPKTSPANEEEASLHGA